LRLLALILFSALVPVQILGAQASPDGEHRPWIELGLGGSRQNANCLSCFRKKIGGATASLSIGATITPRFGVALLLRKFEEFSFEYDHKAVYIVGLGQYSPAPGLTLNAGLGTGSQSGDDAPYGDHGRGTVIGGGVALRLPAKSTVGLTLTADWMKTVSGTRRTQSNQPTTSYRPMLFTIGLGLNITRRSARTESRSLLGRGP
jgi:hypothetical protein